MTASELGWVALGGALGAPLRALVSAWAAGTALGRPLGTLLVNLAGSLALGLVLGWLARVPEGASTLRPLVAVGLLGSFTTFSTFALEAGMAALRWLVDRLTIRSFDVREPSLHEVFVRTVEERDAALAAAAGGNR